MSIKPQRPGLELLEDRLAPAVQAFFNGGILTVTGDNAANNISVAADNATGNLVVTEQGQAVTIQVLSGQATRAQVTQVVIDGRGGDDVLTTDRSLNTFDSNGALAFAPSGVLLGGGGNDTLQVLHGGIVGGLAGLTIQDGVATVTGQVVGNSYMDGGSGNDNLISGPGNDIMLGGTGDDTYSWPPGTLTDVWDGGAGNDTAIIIGNSTPLLGSNADQFSLTANGERVLFQRTNLVRFSVDIGSTENIVLRPGDGDDVVTIGDLSGVRSLKVVTVEGGAGNDVLDGSLQKNTGILLKFYGGEGNDRLIGGAGKSVFDGGSGNDFLQGGGRSDVLIGGEGDDVLVGGKGANVLSGGSGADTFVSTSKCDLITDLEAGQGDVVQSTIPPVN